MLLVVAPCNCQFPSYDCDLSTSALCGCGLANVLFASVTFSVELHEVVLLF